MRRMSIQGDRVLVCMVQLYWIWDLAKGTCVALHPSYTSSSLRVGVFRPVPGSFQSQLIATQQGTIIFSRNYIASPVRDGTAMAIWSASTLQANALPVGSLGADLAGVAEVMPEGTLSLP